MRAVFADTAFYVALLSRRDEHHKKTLEFAGSFTGVLITTEYILIETGNRLARYGDRAPFVALVRQLQGTPGVRIVPAGVDRFEAGLILYANRGDKQWSLTDCISFAVMRQERLTEAATTDHHFQQAGFSVLLA